MSIEEDKQQQQQQQQNDDDNDDIEADSEQPQSPQDNDNDNGDDDQQNQPNQKSLRGGTGIGHPTNSLLPIPTEEMIRDYEEQQRRRESGEPPMGTSEHDYYANYELFGIPFHMLVCLGILLVAVTIGTVIAVIVWDPDGGVQPPTPMPTMTAMPTEIPTNMPTITAIITTTGIPTMAPVPSPTTEAPI